MDIERELLWWKYVKSDVPQLFGWNFLIINEPREIRMITDKLCYELGSVPDIKRIDSDIIENSGGFHYSLFTLFSPKSKIDFGNVYQGKARRDRRLQRRETEQLELFSRANCFWRDLI